MSRTLNRSIARNLYGKFSAEWRKELRKAGLYGNPKAPKRPTFSQWYVLHEKDQATLQQSTPSDVMEYLEAVQEVDPWLEAKANEASDEGGERGVVTIPIVGDDE